MKTDEVIRCRDCKHQTKFFWKDGRREDGGYCVYGCDLTEDSRLGFDDDFCSEVERKVGTIAGYKD